MNFLFGFSRLPLVLGGLLILLGNLFAYQAVLRSSEILSVRSMGMGWAYTAVANDETILQANPAGIGIWRKFFQIEDHDSVFYFFPIKFGYSENIFRSLTYTQEFDAYFDTKENNINYSVEVNSPTDFVYLGDIWGISLITRGFLNILNEAGIENNYYQFQVFSKLNFGFKLHSFSFLSDQDFHVGIGTKLMYLIQMEKRLSNQEISERFDRSINDIEDLSKSSLISIFAESLNYFEGITLGVDFGFLWEIHLGDSEHQINLGMMVENAPAYGFSADIATDELIEPWFSSLCESFYNERDILLPDDDVESFCEYEDGSFKGAESSFFKVNGKVGIAYMLPDYMGGFFSDTMVAFDVHRIGDFDYRFSEMYHVGISTTIFDMVDFRTGYSYRMNLSVGVSQNQFNAGYLIHLNMYEIGYNYFREKVMGFDYVVERHLLTFAFYF